MAGATIHMKGIVIMGSQEMPMSSVILLTDRAARSRPTNVLIIGLMLKRRIGTKNPVKISISRSSEDKMIPI